MKNNAFGALRLFAALLVTFSHSYPISAGSGIAEPPYPLLQFSFGTVGVYLFFAISGMLVTKSLVESKSITHFITYRVCRIYPAVIACSLITALVLGPFYTTASLADYFSSIDLLRFIWHNSTIVFGLVLTLPSVFASNPLPLAVNDSMWTLPWELRAYFFLLIGGTLLGIKRGWKVSAILLGLAALNMFFFMRGEKPANLFFAFFFGGFLYQIRTMLVRRYALLMVVTVAALFLYRTANFEQVFVVWLTVFAFVVGFTPVERFSLFERYDLSYGVYLYSFPVGQALEASFRIANPVVMFLLTAAIAGTLAFASWTLIEKRSLDAKRRIADSINEWCKGKYLNWATSK